MFSCNSSNASRYNCWQLSFSSHFLDQSTSKSSVKKTPRQICKIKYESIIITSHLIRQLCMVRSDLLGETVVNFSYSVQTLMGKKKTRVQKSTPKGALIITITENTMKLLLKVKQPLEMINSPPECIAWIILLLLITKLSPKVRKSFISWWLGVHLT